MFFVADQFGDVSGHHVIAPRRCVIASHRHVIAVALRHGDAGPPLSDRVSNRDSDRVSNRVSNGFFVVVATQSREWESQMVTPPR